MPDLSNFHLEPDLQTGVIPVSKAASALAALLKRARSEGRPIVITQKGFPTGVLMSIDLFTALSAAVEAAEPPTPPPDDEPA